MKDNNTALAKGIFYNKKTGLCIFETNHDKIKWFNVHTDNIEGKFFQGCRAKLYQNGDDILKAVIVDTKKKK